MFICICLYMGKEDFAITMVRLLCTNLLCDWYYFQRLSRLITKGIWNSARIVTAVSQVKASEAVVRMPQALPAPCPPFPDRSCIRSLPHQTCFLLTVSILIQASVQRQTLWPLLVSQSTWSPGIVFSTELTFRSLPSFSTCPLSFLLFWFTSTDREHATYGTLS